MKQIFIDVETSGTQEWKHGIWQLAGGIRINGVIARKFNYKFAILPSQEWDPVAFGMSGMTEEERDALPASPEFFEHFKNLLEEYVDPYSKHDKFHFYAYNSPFDERFVRKFFYNHGSRFYGSYFWVPTVCVMKKAMDVVGDARALLPNFKLATVAKHFDIEVEGDELHDAMYDIDLTMKLYDKITNG